MANKLYPLGKDYILTNGGIVTGNVKAVLVTTVTSKGANNYYPQSDSDQFLSAVPLASRIAPPIALTNKATNQGAYSADPVTFPAVTGSSTEALVLYLDTGNEATSPLVGYFDTVAGLPAQPSGSDIQIVWDTGATKIFAI